MKADEVHSDSDDMIGWPHFSLIKPLLDSGQDNNTAQYSETRACQAKALSEAMVMWKLQSTIRQMAEPGDTKKLAWKQITDG